MEKFVLLKNLKSYIILAIILFNVFIEVFESIVTARKSRIEANLITANLISLGWTTEIKNVYISLVIICFILKIQDTPHVQRQGTLFAHKKGFWIVVFRNSYLWLHWPVFMRSFAICYSDMRDF